MRWRGGKYPNKEQENYLSRACGVTRFTYNWALNEWATRFFPSTKTCSCCDNIKNDLKLSDRIYECGKCNLVINRDLVGITNSLVINKLPAVCREVTLVDIPALAFYL